MSKQKKEIPQYVPYFIVEGNTSTMNENSIDLVELIKRNPNDYELGKIIRESFMRKKK